MQGKDDEKAQEAFGEVTVRHFVMLAKAGWFVCVPPDWR